MWGAPAPSPESGPLLGAAPARQVWAGSWAPSRGGAWASHCPTPTSLLPSSSHVFSSVPPPAELPRVHALCQPRPAPGRGQPRQGPHPLVVRGCPRVATCSVPRAHGVGAWDLPLAALTGLHTCSQGCRRRLSPGAVPASTQHRGPRLSRVGWVGSRGCVCHPCSPWPGTHRGPGHQSLETEGRLFGPAEAPAPATRPTAAGRRGFALTPRPSRPPHTQGPAHCVRPRPSLTTLPPPRAALLRAGWQVRAQGRHG